MQVAHSRTCETLRLCFCFVLLRYSECHPLTTTFQIFMITFITASDVLLF